MGTSGSKEVTQWNTPATRNITCGRCGEGWAGDVKCATCRENLVIPKKLVSKVNAGDETTVLLGIPSEFPIEADMGRLFIYWKGIDSVKKKQVFFTQKAEYLDIPSAIMVNDEKGRVQFLFNPLSKVVITAAKRLFQDPSDTKGVVKDIYETLVSVCTWPKGEEVNPNGLERLRMNVLTHGPQRFYTSLFKLSKLKYHPNESRLKLQGGFPMVLNLTRRDTAILRDVNPSPLTPCKPPPSSQGLYMWTPCLLNIISPPLKMPDFIRADKLIALSFFFKVPLVDRTDVLNKTSCLRLKGMDPLPSFTELENRKYKETPVASLMEDRALQIVKDSWAAGKKICILWSGGIDSTAVVVSLLKAVGLQGDGRLPACPVVDGVASPVLFIGYSQAAVAEYPWFFENILEKYRKTGVLGYIQISETTPVSLQLDLTTYQYITGECGDQMFGSDVMSNAFDLTDSQAWEYSSAPNPSEREPFLSPFKLGLEADWRDTLLESLVLSGLTSADEKQDWVEWLTPQLEKAPFAIKTTFDLLWWLNYTCKWQHVVLRIFNFREVLTVKQLAGVTHFFRSEPFQLWSFANHHLKLPNKSNWATYKEPLKAYIKSYTSDEEYYRNKLKCGSLGYIMLQNDTAEHDILAVDSTLEFIKAGAHSISPSLFRKIYNNSVKEAYLRRIP